MARPPMHWISLSILSIALVYHLPLPLPSLQALRDWPAYGDYRAAIDDFQALLPLFQSLTHRAVRERHWAELMTITGTQLNLAEDSFKLQHLLDAGLLKHRQGRSS